MLRFWRNPEFARHLRADLRPARATIVAVVVVVVCSLIGLACWSAEHKDLRGFFTLYYHWLVGCQYVFVGLWCASTCGQAIARERELKTYDFLKTTRLTPGELLVGKLLGAPVTAYFALGCSMLVSLVAGGLAGYGARQILGVYFLLLAFTLFTGLVALWGSMLVEKSSSGAAGLFTLIVMTGMFGLVATPYPGFGTLSVLPGVLELFDVRSGIMESRGTLFGVQVSYLLLTILLYATLGAWFVLMMVRNLKKDLEQIRLLSRWQAVGLAAYINLLLYAFLSPKFLDPKRTAEALTPRDITGTVVILNSGILFLVGLATLTPKEKLKMWWRRRAAGEVSLFHEHSLPWPWLLPAAGIAYALLAAEALGLQSRIPVHEWPLGASAVQMLVILVFVTRDILFLQWCTLTRMRRPLMIGFLYLFLYYIAVLIVSVVVDNISEPSAGYVLGLTPYYAMTPKGVGLRVSPGIYVGLALQLPILALLFRAIAGRLRRPAVVPVAGAAAIAE